MNQNLITIACVFLASILGTVSSNWQTNKERDTSETTAVTILTTEFKGVKGAVNSFSGDMKEFSGQMTALNSGQSVLKAEVIELKQFKKDASERLRALEVKVK